MEGRSALRDEGFRVTLVGKDGKEWTNIVPDATVTIVSTDPAAGTVTKPADIAVTVNVSQDEFVAATKVVADAAKLATRYGFQCGISGGTQTTYKSYKEVRASPDYAGSSTCMVTIAGKVSWDKGQASLIPSEQTRGPRGLQGGRLGGTPGGRQHINPLQECGMRVIGRCPRSTYAAVNMDEAGPVSWRVAGCIPWTDPVVLH